MKQLQYLQRSLSHLGGRILAQSLQKKYIKSATSDFDYENNFKVRVIGFSADFDSAALKAFRCLHRCCRSYLGGTLINKIQSLFA